MLKYFLYFISLGLAYILINRPFLNLSCHHDAGWHSYWAAFRKQGVTLQKQMNMLVGCARLGMKYYYVFLFKVFGLQDPELISRKAFLVINYLTAVGLFIAVRLLSIGDRNLAFFVPVIYLIISSNPFWGIHYDSSERTAGIFNVSAVILLVMFLLQGNKIFLILGLILFFLGAFFFKISQFIEFFPVWVFFIARRDAFENIILSGVTFLACLLLFLFFLKLKGLLRRENLGIFGYLSTGYELPQLKTIIENRINNLKSWVLRLFFRLTLSVSQRFGFFNFLAKWAEKIYKLRLFLPNIYQSSRAVLLLAIIAPLIAPHYKNIELLGLAWCLGCIFSVFLQGRHLHLHYIPLIIPVSILAGLGVFKLLSLPLNPASIAIILLLGLAIYLDIRKFIGLFNKSRTQDLEYGIWPDFVKDMVDKNIAAARICDYIKHNTREDDYILAWGCLPQFYVLAQRRSPVPWLNTSRCIMDPVLPGWREIMLANIKNTEPKFLVVFENDFNLKAFSQSTGLHYILDNNCRFKKYPVYRLGRKT